MEASPSTDEILEVIKHKKLKIQRMLNDFSRNPPTLDDINGDEDFTAMKNLLSSAIEVLKEREPTAEFWLQYFNFIMLAIRYIEAERLGNWNLHLYCVQQMLPVYHAAGHSNYVKAIQIYLQQMSKLQDTMDPEEYNLFTEKGHFTVRRSEKAWAGIWTDMTIEQMLMCTIHTGAQGLLHGRGMTSSVMTRFLEASPLFPGVGATSEESTYIAQIWCNAYKQVPSTLFPINYGWDVNDGRYDFDWFHGEECPQKVCDVTEPDEESGEEDDDVIENNREDNSDVDEDVDSDNNSATDSDTE